MSIAEKQNIDTIKAFQEGDIVNLLHHGCDNNFYGVVSEVNPKEHKVYVAWSGGKVAQHEPNELQFHPNFIDACQIYSRYNNCVSNIVTAALENEENTTSADVGPAFMGSPETHGMEEPVRGGFGIMQDLVHDLRKESISGEIKVGGSRRSQFKRAVYHRQKGRVYQRSRSEVEYDVIACPKCRTLMDEHNFTRSIKLWMCPDCGWKIPSSNII
jgi:predicted RNA-binding Zn-ribbon protein involved in translation (DUF1610 family)